jgi:DNA-binding NarL/FixJ family response regulator
MTCLMLSDDLMFNSRVMGTAREFGGAVRTARNSEGLIALARSAPPTCVIIDLANPGLDIVGFVQELQRLEKPPRMIAYGSHVDTAVLQAAREAGCEVVMARSQFVTALPTQLQLWMKPSE